METEKTNQEGNKGLLKKLIGIEGITQSFTDGSLPRLNATLVYLTDYIAKIITGTNDNGFYLAFNNSTNEQDIVHLSIEEILGIDLLGKTIKCYKETIPF